MIDIFNKQTKKNPDKTIIVFKNRFISYKKFNYMVNNAMPNIIQNDSNYIGIQIKNKLKLLVTIIAINRLGKIPVLYPSNENINSYIKSTKIPIDIKDSNLLINCAKNEQKDLSYKKNNIQTILFTSGSTGIPKACQLSFENLYQSSLIWNDIIKFKKDDIYLNHMPLTHVSGLCIFFRALYNNFTMIIDEFNPSNYIQYLNTNKVTLISMVPYMLKQIIKNNSNINFLYTKAIIISGEFIDNKLMKIIENYKIPAYISYGMSETSSGIAGFWANQKYGYKPHKNVNITVNNKKINIESKTVMLGYLNQEKNNNHYKTNDEGYIDKNGILTIKRRTDDIINTGGEKFSIKYTKQLIEEIDEIKKCKIEIIKCTKWGNAIHAHIILKNKISRNKLITKIKGILPNYMFPREFYIK